MTPHDRRGRRRHQGRRRRRRREGRDPGPAPGRHPGPGRRGDHDGDHARSSRRCGPSTTIEAVGIGIAGFVDAARSKVYFAPNLLGWRDGPLREEVEQRVGLPVVVENDANAAAWGEARFGAGRERAVHRLRDGRAPGSAAGSSSTGRLYRGGFGVGGRDRAHPDGRGRPAVRLRPARLLGAVRQRRSPGARGPGARRGVAGPTPRSCSASATARRRASPASTSPRRRAGRPGRQGSLRHARPLARAGAGRPGRGARPGVLRARRRRLRGRRARARPDRGGLRAAADRPRPPADGAAWCWPSSATTPGWSARPTSRATAEAAADAQGLVLLSSKIAQHSVTDDQKRDLCSVRLSRAQGRTRTVTHGNDCCDSRGRDELVRRSRHDRGAAAVEFALVGAGACSMVDARHHSTTGCGSATR